MKKNIYIQFTRHAVAIANQPIKTPHFLGKTKKKIPWKQTTRKSNKQTKALSERKREM